MRRALIGLGLALSLAGCGSARSAGPTSSSARASASARRSAPEALPPGSHLLLDATEPLSSAYVAGGSLYYAYTNPVGEHTGEDYVLIDVDASTGHPIARRRFDSALDDMLLSGGSLWVTTNAGNVTSLWRLDPRSLALRGRHELPSSSSSEGIAGSLAAAGGQLWVGTGTIDRVSLGTGRVDRVIRPSHPGPVGLVADRTGHILLASLGYEHPTYIARLNPETGALLSEIELPVSDTQPTFGGIAGGGAWIENRVGSHVSAWPISVRTLKGTGTRDLTIPASRISVQALDGVLWVTEPRGQDSVSYCADPVSGRPLDRLPPLPGDSVFLTADRTALFYTEVPVNGHSVKLETAPISRACLAG